MFQEIRIHYITLSVFLFSLARQTDFNPHTMEHLIRFVVSGELAKCQLCVGRERLYRVSGNALHGCRGTDLKRLKISDQTLHVLRASDLHYPNASVSHARI
jgi:hypothetical protein